MSSKNSILLRRIFILAIFITLNMVAFIAIVNSLKYFSSDADRSRMLRTSVKIENQYQPKANWKNLSKANELQIIPLQKDYITYWYRRFLANRYNDSSLQIDFITKENTKFVDSLQKIAKEEHFYSEIITLEHNPTISFFSEDGKFAVIDDSAIQVLKKDYHKNTLVNVQKTLNHYQATMISEDGNWKMRQLTQLSSENKVDSVQIKPSSSQLKVNDENFTMVGTNYYPQNLPWENIWEVFEARTIAKDLQFLSQNGINSIRVFFPYEKLGKANIPENSLKNIDTFFALCKKYNMYVIPTLFDFFYDYDIENYTLADRHLETLLSRYRNETQIIAWDIKNEADLDFAGFGRQKVQDWLEFIIERAQNYDPNHPLTIGWSNAESATILQDKLEFITFHYYKNPSDFEETFTSLQEKIQDKPIAITEFGTHSFDGFWYPFGKNEQQQESYYFELFSAMKKVKCENFMHWTLYDFNNVPDEVVGVFPWRKKMQEHFGFIDINGKQKRNFKYISGKVDVKPEKSYKNYLNHSRIFFIGAFLLFIVIIFIIVKYFGWKRIKALILSLKIYLK